MLEHTKDAVERFQLFEQAVADAALNDSGGVVGDGGAVERFADALLNGGRQHGSTRQSDWQISPDR